MRSVLSVVGKGGYGRRMMAEDTLRQPSSMRDVPNEVTDGTEALVEQERTWRPKNPYVGTMAQNMDLAWKEGCDAGIQAVVRWIDQNLLVLINPREPESAWNTAARRTLLEINARLKWQQFHDG